MSFSIKAFLCCSLLGAMGFLAAGPEPQDGAVNPGGDAPATNATVTDANRNQQGGAPQTVRDRYEEAFQVQSDFKAILDTFYATKDGPEKEAKRAELKKKLTDIFDADMKARKAQAEEIEKRLNVLQEQYKAREAAKERIIDLQIEVLEKDAAGLGFPAGGDGKLLSRNGEASKRLLSRVAVPDFTEAPQANSGSSRTSRPLQQVLLDSPVIVDDLKKRGHFIVSDDQKLFAHVGGNYPQGPWTIKLQDAATGKLLASYVARTEVAEIRFQEGGVGVRLPDGKFEVRIPVDAAAKLGGAAEPPVAFPDDPKFRPLGWLKQHDQRSLDQARQRGEFIETMDGRFYAASYPVVPSGPTLLYLVDAATGKTIARAIVEKPVSHILFTEKGVSASEAGRPPELKIPFAKTAQDFGSGGKASSASSEISQDTPLAITDKSGEVVDYSKLRKEYLNSKLQFDRANEDLKAKVNEAKKSNPAISDQEIETLKQSSADYRRSVSNRYQEALTILETKLKLLALDVEAAKASLRVAEAELSNAEEVKKAKAGSINESEMRRLQLAMDKHRIEVIRASTVLDLFETIKKDGEPKPEAATERKR